MPADMPTGEQTVPNGPALLLCGARLPHGRHVDVRIVGDRIEAVGPAGSLSAAERLDLSGYLLLPAPVEPHAHLDEAFSGTPATGPAPLPDSEAGTGLGAGLGVGMRVGASSGAGSGARAGAWAWAAGESDRDQQVEALQRRITEAALTGLGYGATVQRTHVRISGAQGLVAMTAALQAAQALHGLMELQVVPLPGLLTGVAGAEGRAVLKEALGMGAHAVGGRPDHDADPDRHLDAVVALAEDYGLSVDLHTDAADPRRLARLAAVLGALRSRAVIGPCSALGLLPPEVAARCMEQLAAAGVSVVTLPQCARCVGSGPVALGRAVGRPASARLLLAAGVSVATGSGALRDTANPVGRVDPLEAAFLLTASGELDETAAYETVSGAARMALGLASVQLAAGFPADVLAVRGESLREVLSGGHSRVVVHGGRIVSRTSAVREFAESGAPAVPRQGRSGPGC
jgi:cytosine deaminase